MPAWRLCPAAPGSVPAQRCWELQGPEVWGQVGVWGELAWRGSCGKLLRFPLQPRGAARKNSRKSWAVPPPQEVCWDELTQGLSFSGVMQLETSGVGIKNKALGEGGSQEG